MPNKIWSYIKKNYTFIVMLVATAVLLISPDAKSFVIKQLMFTGLFNAHIEEPKPTVTDSFLDFDFLDENGRIVNTATLRGKVVFINFWTSWCPPCRAEFPSIEKLYTTLRHDSSIFFLIINEDNDLAKGKAYLQTEKYNIPFFTRASSISEEIYTGKLPTTIVLDKKGKIRFHHTGFANYASAAFIEQMQQLARE